MKTYLMLDMDPVTHPPCGAPVRQWDDTKLNELVNEAVTEQLSKILRYHQWE